MNSEIGREVMHVDEGMRRGRPPGVIVSVEGGTTVRVQPFDPERPAWTADLTAVVADTGIWYPEDGARPARSSPFPIPPGVRAPRQYGCYRR
ncbi:hypothetical protein ABIA38_000926 [Embleya sp. AB8]